MHKLELRPGRRNALAAGAAEATAGVLLAPGALTPLAGALITSTMITAIRKVHGANGPWIQQQDYEYNLALIATVAAIVDCGPGSPSLDRALGVEARGNAWMFASLAAGAAGSTLAIEAGRRLGAAETPQSKPEQPAEEPNQGATGRFSRNGQTPDSEPARQAARRPASPGAQLARTYSERPGPPGAFGSSGNGIAQLLAECAATNGRIAERRRSVSDGALACARSAASRMRSSCAPTAERSNGLAMTRPSTTAIAATVMPASFSAIRAGPAIRFWLSSSAR
jgi:putative oxidoreductase